MQAEPIARRSAGLTGLLIALAALTPGCAALPEPTVERSLYRDLRTLVELGEDDGWVIDAVRLAANAEPALHSLCQVAPEPRADLDAWLGGQLALREAASARDGARSEGAGPRVDRSARSLERTRALLRYANSRALADCPAWLVPRADFSGTQGDAGRWVLLAETSAFATYVIDSQVPALGGGGRVLVGRGLGERLSLAAGAEMAASGTFIPSAQGGQGLDGIFTLAFPVLLRVANFSRIADLELAPVARFERGGHAFPPGARIEVGAGISSIRKASLASYFMLYAGYEYHPEPRSGKHTVQIGTRLAFDWNP